MDISTLNWLAVTAAALSAFILGGLWYSPAMFGKVWQRENQLSDEKLKQGSMGRVFGFAFVWAFVMAFNLGIFLNTPFTDMWWGLVAGLLAGVGWVAMAIFIIGLFERKSTIYMLINAGYMIVSFAIMGLIIGGWR